MEATTTKATAEQLAEQLKKIFQGMASRVTALGLDAEQWDQMEEEILQGWTSVQPVLAQLRGE